MTGGDDDNEQLRANIEKMGALDRDRAYWFGVMEFIQKTLQDEALWRCVIWATLLICCVFAFRWFTQRSRRQDLEKQR